MKDNVIALPVGRIRRDTAVSRRKQDLDQDLFVDMVRNHPGLIARREARQQARQQAAAQEREEQNQLLCDVATVGMFSMLGAVLAVGLIL